MVVLIAQLNHEVRQAVSMKSQGPHSWMWTKQPQTTTTVSDFRLLQCLQHGTAIHATGLRGTTSRAATVRGLIIAVVWLFTSNSSTTPNAGTHSAKNRSLAYAVGFEITNLTVMVSVTKDKIS